jgi:GDPmannose 4,6-dehydratase
MWLMLQQIEPRDYVIGTGQAHSVRDLCELAFAYVGLDWERFVELDPRYLRPTEVESLLADPSQAEKDLGWTAKTTFREVIAEMVEADLAAVDLDIDAARTLAKEKFPESCID